MILTKVSSHHNNTIEDITQVNNDEQYSFEKN